MRKFAIIVGAADHAGTGPSRLGNGYPTYTETARMYDSIKP